MKYATAVTEISRGLMFASKKRIAKGLCMVMPSTGDVKFGSSVTMFFCFSSLDVLFVNLKFEVVDKKTLKPWLPNYTPISPCKYVIESTPGCFKDINIGDKVSIKQF